MTSVMGLRRRSGGPETRGGGHYHEIIATQPYSAQAAHRQETGSETREGPRQWSHLGTTARASPDWCPCHLPRVLINSCLTSNLIGADSSDAQNLDEACKRGSVSGPGYQLVVRQWSLSCDVHRNLCIAICDYPCQKYFTISRLFQFADKGRHKEEIYGYCCQWHKLKQSSDSIQTLIHECKTSIRRSILYIKILKVHFFHFICIATRKSIEEFSVLFDTIFGKISFFLKLIFGLTLISRLFCSS